MVTETEGLWSGIGAAIAAMPPEIAAIVILALSAMLLVYSWRRATDEAQKERAKAQEAAAGLDTHKLDSILSAVNTTAEKVADIKEVVAILKDRKS